MFKKLILRAAQHYGYQIRHEPGLMAFLQSRSVDLVLDVGANAGQYAQYLRFLGYKGAIWSFEPVADAFAELKRASADDRLWDVTRCAVGARPGEVEIKVTANNVYSSIRPPSSYGEALYPSLECVATETVPVITIDSLTASAQSRSIFIKIDTQGYEREVLEGATESLKRCVGLQLELPVEHLYDDVWSFSEAVAHVDALGFNPAQFRMVNPIRGDDASGVEFDCILKRKLSNPGSATSGNRMVCQD